MHLHDYLKANFKSRILRLLRVLHQNYRQVEPALLFLRSCPISLPTPGSILHYQEPHAYVGKYPSPHTQALSTPSTSLQLAQALGVHTP